MKTEDVERTVNRALKIADLPKDYRPRLLADNGACYIASELKEFLNNKKMKLIHGKQSSANTRQD
jgi:putative transposase